MLTRLTFALPLAALLIACGSDADDALRPASTVASETQAAVQTAEIGKAFEVGKLRVTVRAIEYPAAPDGRSLDPDQERFVLVDLLIENPTDDELTPPDINVTCAGGDSGGWYVFEGDGALDSRELPPKSFIEGKHLMDQPKPCERPALEVSATGVFIGTAPEPVAIPLD